MHSLRVALNRTTRDDEVAPTVGIPTPLYFTEDPHFGAINIIGLTQAGSTATIPASYDQRLFQLTDTVTWQRGAHQIKAGVDWQHYGFQGFSYSRYGGEFRFRTLEEFLTLRRSSSAQADRFTGNLPGTDTLRHMSQHYVALFAQDEWRLRPIADPERRPALRLRDDAGRTRRAGGGPAQPRRPGVGPRRRHARRAAV